jgi:hypothetical protein
MQTHTQIASNSCTGLPVCTQAGNVEASPSYERGSTMYASALCACHNGCEQTIDMESTPEMARRHACRRSIPCTMCPASGLAMLKAPNGRGFHGGTRWHFGWPQVASCNGGLQECWQQRMDHRSSRYISCICELLIKYCVNALISVL